MKHYDLAVIGTGPAGQKAAIQGAKLGKKVVITEKTTCWGRDDQHRTIPSKALREAVMHLTGHPSAGFSESLIGSSAISRSRI